MTALMGRISAAVGVLLCRFAKNQRIKRFARIWIAWFAIDFVVF
jgi:hypothetical protein